MPDQNLVEVPENVPLTKAALADPLAVSRQAARLGVAALHPGADRCALMIGGGPIGLAAASALAQPGGLIVHVGPGEDVGGLNVQRMTFQEIRFIGTYTYTANILPRIFKTGRRPFLTAGLAIWIGCNRAPCR